MLYDDYNLGFLKEIIDNDLLLNPKLNIHTRFPPEPNGYLHIGSAKAIIINFIIAKKYNGKFNLRFDDTNPIKEKSEYVENIIKDLVWLINEKPNGGIHFGSDYFEQCYKCAIQLIENGKAYVCDLSTEEIKNHRGNLKIGGINSPFRNRSIDENLTLFLNMKNGKYTNNEKTLRAKIDMNSSNINMRDPIIYRIIHKKHHKQLTKWCIYPLYDFAHPIQDAIENISHSLCSIEFENHKPLYEWVIKNINIDTKVRQYEFSRLNITKTITSKRYLNKLILEKIVDDWDDPRMPTLCGLRKRGYTPNSIINFIKAIGVSKSTGIVDIKLLEHCIREELNKNALRLMCILDPLKIIITNYDQEFELFELNNYPKNIKAQEKRKVYFTKELFIERNDFLEIYQHGFKRLTLGGQVRLIGSYIIKCDTVVKDINNNITELKCSIVFAKEKQKIKGNIHWVSAKFNIESDVYIYDYLFKNDDSILLKDENDITKFINKNSLKIYKAKFENYVNCLPNNTRFQAIRIGYFIKEHQNKFNQIVELKGVFNTKIL